MVNAELIFKRGLPPFAPAAFLTSALGRKLPLTNLNFG
jgi:hypothetical protein